MTQEKKGLERWIYRPSFAWSMAGKLLTALLAVALLSELASICGRRLRAGFQKSESWQVEIGLEKQEPAAPATEKQGTVAAPVPGVPAGPGDPEEHRIALPTPKVAGGATRIPDHCGIADKAFSFNGRDAFLDFGKIHVSAPPLTVAFWFQARNRNSPGRSLFACLGRNFEGIQAYTGEHARIEYRIGGPNDTVLECSPLVGDGGWHFVALTRDASKTTLYLDGEHRTEQFSPVGFRIQENLYVGSFPKDPNVREPAFDGAVADFRIYRSCWTAEEVRRLHEAER